MFAKIKKLLLGRLAEVGPEGGHGTLPEYECLIVDARTYHGVELQDAFDAGVVVDGFRDQDRYVLVVRHD